MALDMFIDMGAIKGESRDKENKEKIDILAWSWGMTQSGTTHTGGGGGSGKASFQDISFTKYIDSSTNAMMNALAKGTHLDKVVLSVRKAGEAQQKDYIVITMEEVLVSSISTGGSGGEDRLTENVTLNFGKVSFAYTPQDSKGTLSGAKTFTWNIAENDGNVA